MRRLVILGGLIVAFGLGIAAQELHFFPFAPGTAFPELVPPCPADRVEPQIVILDGRPEAWGIWHCLDGRFIPYRFTTITGIAPGPPTNVCPGLAPRPGWVCVNGGWRDPVTVR